MSDGDTKFRHNFQKEKVKQTNEVANLLIIVL